MFRNFSSVSFKLHVFFCSRRDELYFHSFYFTNDRDDFKFEVALMKPCSGISFSKFAFKFSGKNFLDLYIGDNHLQR